MPFWTISYSGIETESTHFFGDPWRETTINFDFDAHEVGASETCLVGVQVTKAGPKSTLMQLGPSLQRKRSLILFVEQESWSLDLNRSRTMTYSSGCSIDRYCDPSTSRTRQTPVPFVSRVRL